MEFTAQMIASFLHGEIEGDPDVKVNNVAKIEEAQPGTLAFLSNPKYNNYLYTTQASIVLINKDFVIEKEVKPTLIKVPNAYEAFASLLQLAQQGKTVKTGIENPVSVSETAQIGENVYIGAFAYIGDHVKIGKNVRIYPQVFIGNNVTIGDNSIIFPGVKIYEDCILGNECTIHAGSVIGADGFGFAPQSDNNYKKIPQIGNVVLEDFVEIGANATIDRATMGSTIIRKGVKLDNLTHVAHNVEVGENTVMAAQSGIAGSTKIGKNCMFGGQVGFASHITIADGVKAAAQSGIASSIKEENLIVMGAPAYKISDYQKAYIGFKRLPDMIKQIYALEKEIKELKSNQK
ncbi:MAG: UDP-3-O-(3-hydroxymyristoyl)glucosamine N-acyltransferase [Bacteroidetes bacterium GWC2_33_15]|nr:MAG: UDP-3-O-(3-hydroxymyristoyl)glucosamine N-acyltransferase [Bacteroidetes bacterium GWA2_33_15]OFX51990.1 MAG: UDP-3-O-(3-hydroxymyristoyl)glucosamine N-acyltransferase [Bacteroidetes bacterium GWC2_33_15]OFX63820.1 MAG: UDP-3-O-(3-hydroxymyristoyl)glucosamine N-acyltransferase [Bacteroidetes bacterium GWB2_32_14]OFX67393.1 MAG: UDP-3-O-(3-hydroxymyristoyl)glucosamine N-acyltransferase [Bacteroidetes bacterium GWD2_33_33]HAN17844.1 UDP-3-O-(3-hydroxymyristoyl)glucosamine N-acyltransferas